MPSCHVTPVAEDSKRIDNCRPLTRIFIKSVNTSTGDVAERVIVALLDPPSEAGELRPDPDPLNACKVIVATGLSAVEPSKDASGTTRLTNENLSPSPMSKSEDSTYAVIAAALDPALSSIPSSWSTIMWTVTMLSVLTVI